MMIELLLYPLRCGPRDVNINSMIDAILFQKSCPHNMMQCELLISIKA